MLEVANPRVSITGMQGLNHITLPVDFKSPDLLSIESSSGGEDFDYPLFEPWVKEDENAMLNTTSFDGSGLCDGLPDHRNPLPNPEAGMERAFPGIFPSIFATSADGVVFLYDRHLTLYENTVEKPVSDIYSSRHELHHPYIIYASIF